MRVSVFSYHQIMCCRMRTDMDNTLIEGAYTEDIDGGKPRNQNMMK